MKPPAFQFYADDFLGGTMHFTDSEVGLYVRLLCIQWSTGSLPDDDQELSSYGKGVTPLARIKAKFQKGADGRLRNPRLEDERTKQAAYRENQSSSGRKGAEKRWHGDPNGGAIATPMANTMAKHSSPSPSPSPSSVSDSVSVNLAPAKPSRARNPHIDALASVEGIALTEISGKVGARLATALATIRETNPDVTPAEILRRGANLRLHFSTSPTAMSLASHWGKCHESPTARRNPHHTPAVTAEEHSHGFFGDNSDVK